MELTVEGHSIATTEEGFLINKDEWNEKVAIQLASLNAITLTKAHWEIILFSRSFYDEYQFLPNTRQFIKAIAKTLGEHKGNSRYLHQLFPAGPLKYACKLAGLPKPPTCL